MLGKISVTGIISLIICLFAANQTSANTILDSIGVETVEGSKFIKHRVESGEGWYSIARKYGISYAELRMANKKEGDKLVIGQILLIPAKAKLNDPRFQKNYIDKKTIEPSTAKSIPLESKTQPTGKTKTHKIIAGETLFGISRIYSVSVDEIKKWNDLKDNTIEVGQELIVGTDNSLSKKQDIPADIKEVGGNKKDKIAVSPNIESMPKNTEKKSEEIESAPPGENTVIVKTISPESVDKESKKNDKKYSFANGRQEVNEQGVASWIEDEDINPNKYYALHRTAPIGTIIKVTNKMNNNTVFVKVVGVLQETGDNEGLLIKISKASAERLNVLDKKFQADLVYGLSSK